ncbi:MAG: type II toxin-antitoxin system VapC family toxin [Magnetococcales bacterium]|nr:type II toxin-antitoxin system VapC family toxin [Magnetococcales bacterium]MBF0260934.1 type II toxin-antitoxin system VapC family toxin [Magnetococcales bacterium]
MTLVDTNVLLDLFTDDPTWSDWSLQQLNRVATYGPIVINDVVYAELSVRFARIEILDQALEAMDARLERLPRTALFLAGKSFLRYRESGGQRHGVLPDFFIGAHASITGWPLLTRDIRRYRTYFPDVRLIAPNWS